MIMSDIIEYFKSCVEEENGEVNQKSFSLFQSFVEVFNISDDFFEISLTPDNEIYARRKTDTKTTSLIFGKDGTIKYI